MPHTAFPEAFHETSEPVLRSGHVRFLLVGLAREGPGNQKRYQGAHDGRSPTGKLCPQSCDDHVMDDVLKKASPPFVWRRSNADA